MKKTDRKGFWLILVCSVLILINVYASAESENANNADVSNKEGTYEEKSTSGYGKVVVGDYISFGKYEQDADITNGEEDIEWLVLETEGDYLLVISQNALEVKPFHEENTGVTWASCSLRNWLNDEFYHAAFSEEEKKMISTVAVYPDESSYYNVSLGDCTLDKVFLLSNEEVTKYYYTVGHLNCKVTPYAIQKGAYSDEDAFCRFWLRSPGRDQNWATYVTTNGELVLFGIFVNEDDMAVRPALWINLAL